ncbi:thiamine-phosphate kinase [Myxococcota bacterium]|nr:thiamine-phosphate kinase [Myxococcota bacterium]MBU1433054.1 thiamine-phosphate kinase [Myxococcota bacterium]MBU1898077.1 thiamine-phosphate kinase [Myxococcota bacterium]
MNEASLLDSIARALASEGLRPDLSDDCALAPPTALLTTDALVEGVHFDLATTSARRVGAQAAVCNLSDLAASGGGPGWLLWSLIVPPRWSPALIEEMTGGLAAVARAQGAEILGGNLARVEGPGVLSVTAGGPLLGAAPLRRRGARVGDGVYVTGPLGEAALGLRFQDEMAQAARHAWRPHFAEAAALVSWGGASSAMDISDGLLLDLDRLCRLNGLGADLDAAAIPTSTLYRARLGDDLELALSGGEDYVLLFTASTPPPIGVRVGVCVAGEGLTLNGSAISPRGWDHFAEP